MTRADREPAASVERRHQRSHMRSARSGTDARCVHERNFMRRARLWRDAHVVGPSSCWYPFPRRRPPGCRRHLLLSSSALHMVTDRTYTRRHPRLATSLALALAMVTTLAPSVAHAQGSTAVPTAAATLAVVVHPSNPTDQLTIDQLRRIFLAESFTYPSGARARVAMHSATAPSFAKAALAQRPERVKARWMAAVFAGETSSAPSELASADDVRRYVHDHPDAIAFLPVAA